MFILHLHFTEDYEDLTKPQLVSLVVSYDEKLKALSSELSTLRRSRAASESGAGAKGQERDKYKALARRLKEERNQYKETCEDKLKEQERLKVEMEKMSELIGELRENCQQLQRELLQQQQQQSGGGGGPVAIAKGSSRTVGVQVGSAEANNRSMTNLRKGTAANGASLPPAASEAAKRAKSVYANGKANGSANSNPTTTTTSSRRPPAPTSASNRASSVVSQKNARNAASAPGGVGGVGGGGGGGSAGGGARIVKGVTRPSHPAVAAASNGGKTSPGHGSKRSPSKTSRLPQPSPSRIPQPSPSRVAAVRNKKKGGSGSAAASPSPPPPPPNSQVKREERLLKTPTPPMSPVRPSAATSEKAPTSSSARQLQEPSFDERSVLEDGDEDEEVLVVQEDGEIQMRTQESKAKSSGAVAAAAASSAVSSEADDEGSRDGEAEAEAAGDRLKGEEEDASANNAAAGIGTPSGGRRRAQRTWKNFYDEVRKMREVRIKPKEVISNGENFPRRWRGKRK